MKKFKAAVLTQPNKPLTIVAGVECHKPGVGQVLVKLAFSGVCHSQLMEVRGRRGPDTYLPHLLGHEGSGEVVEIGDGVNKVRPGDLVILGWIKGSGLENGGVQYHCDCLPETINAGCVTTFNEYALVSENRVVPLPPGVPLDIAVLFGCAVPTGAGIITDDLRPTAGSSVAVFGLGGIGLNVVQGAKMVGATRIIGIDLNPARIPLATQFGMTDFINPNEVENVVDHIIDMTGGGVDYSFECIGNVEVMRQALECCHKGWGESCIVGVAGAGKEITTRPFQLVTGRSWRGTAFGGARGRTDVPRIVDWYMDGKINIDDLITHKMPLEDINKAFDLMHAGKSIRSVVEF